MYNKKYKHIPINYAVFKTCVCARARVCMRVTEDKFYKNIARDVCI